MGYYVYVLVSMKDGKFYTGISQNPEARLKAHNQGESKSTKGRSPFKLVYCEEASSRKAARQREKYFKSGVGREFLADIIPR